MEDNELPEKEIPEIPEVNEKDAKISELTDYINNLEFFSNQVKFNSVIYQSLVAIFEKLEKIGAKLNENN